jgi:hypothetical protein
MQNPDMVPRFHRPVFDQGRWASRVNASNDAKSAFASCGHAAALALGCNVPPAVIAAIRGTGFTEFRGSVEALIVV